MSSAICFKEQQWELAAVLAMSGATLATSSLGLFLSASGLADPEPSRSKQTINGQGQLLCRGLFSSFLKDVVAVVPDPQPRPRVCWPSSRFWAFSKTVTFGMIACPTKAEP